eukprot:CAMPEP_0113308412 /NCGR_PEP_ID=MMETSP0010_2-20120614/6861_1 /TAXON_ID=216773 ORGANISM="Corethron hystrix, Strain 308" /NCGR_SAMPLE_ID=MMETSP0010_2 /ASSEMBLY_ACC=CAM_ASM_000155 /LENGTH=218 /DNA_ID=CAMNT_0000163449 /DNA_START=270 /DNA_END=923 /DNA_ORIENTATION=+ /assembly_acc=CAM_ASM_000155
MFGSSGRSRRSRGRRSSSDDGAGMKPSVSERAITEMFKSYAEEDDPTIIGMDGIDKLCTDLEIDPAEDVRGLVLLWKIVGLSQSIPGQISSEEWEKGCTILSLDSLDKFRALVPSLDVGFIEHSDFKDLYKFVFQFNREGTHRTIDRESVIFLLELILGKTGRVLPERLESFITFLKDYKEGERVTLDQWTNFLEFSTKHPADDGENGINTYEEDGAW